MQYTDSINDELKQYFKILVDEKRDIAIEFLKYLNLYLDSNELKRLSGVGMFCGVDYQKLPIHDIKYWYSRLDHSVACALMTLKYTGNVDAVFAALNHDLGTPAFSHTIDFMLGDSKRQESSEIDIKQIIKNSKDLKEKLLQYQVDYRNVYEPSKYSIVENKKPKICADRLDGIFSAGLIWGRFWTLDDVKIFYRDTFIAINENNEKEIGFRNIDIALEFFKGSIKYSMMLQQNEDKMSLKFLSDIILLAISKGIINKQDLYNMTEQEIINCFINSDDEELINSWNTFINLDKTYNSDIYIDDKYCVSVDSKKRYVDPLCKVFNKNYRLSTINKETKEILDEYLKYNDTKYVYIDCIDKAIKRKIKN